MATPHRPVSSHGPTGSVCHFCNKALTALNVSEDCPERERKERADRIAAEVPNMLAVLQDMIPANVCLTNPNVPDSTILPMDVPLGDLRKIAAILARIDGKA